MFWLLKKLILGVISLILLIAVMIGLVLAYLYFHYTNFQAKKFIPSQNALWIEHQWVGEKHTEADYEKLAKQLRDNHITDAYFHVGPLNSEGKIENSKYPYAYDLITNLKRDDPGIRIQAWIGQIEKQGGGILDLSNSQVRQNIVATSGQFLNLGFDGIQYDIEPIATNDKNFLSLLQVTHALTKSQHKLLSVSTRKLEPFSDLGKAIQKFSAQIGFWSKDYYVKVAENSDQIDAMMYETASPKDWIYGDFLAWETRSLINLLNNKTTLFVGMPTYEDHSKTFNPKAENIYSATKGIQLGLKGLPQSKLNHFGTAIYANWTTDQTEWKFFKTNWVGN